MKKELTKEERDLLRNMRKQVPNDNNFVPNRTMLRTVWSLERKGYVQLTVPFGRLSAYRLTDKGRAAL